MAVVKVTSKMRAAVKNGMILGLANKLAYDGEKVYRQELEKTILAAVRAFKTLYAFMACMEPVAPMMKSIPSRDFINGVVEKFREQERDHQRGFGWLHEEVPGGRTRKNVRR
jgi:hypothetical protein